MTRKKRNILHLALPVLWSHDRQTQQLPGTATAALGPLLSFLAGDTPSSPPVLAGHPVQTPNSCWDSADSFCAGAWAGEAAGAFPFLPPSSRKPSLDRAGTPGWGCLLQSLSARRAQGSLQSHHPPHPGREPPWPPLLPGPLTLTPWLGDRDTLAPLCGTCVAS